MSSLAKRALVSAVLLQLVPVDDNRADDSIWTSDAGLYRVSYTSELDPIQINRMHSWIIHVETADGQPLTGAEITLEGGMPAHDHGLPTNPRVTEPLSDGNYRVEGIRFHMSGEWEITVTIDAGAGRDVCVIAVRL